jgi:NHLM bacteriocin system ABC transporter ATP-binding protein
MAPPNPWSALLAEMEAPTLANDSFRIECSTQAWILFKGEVELYAFEHDNEKQTAPRQFLCKLAAGTAIFGLERSADDRLGVLVVPREAELISISASRLLELAVDQRFSALLAKSIDAWISGLSSGLTRSFALRSNPTLTLKPGEEMNAPFDALVCGFRGVVWALPKQGVGRYVGMEELAADPGNPMLPITPDTWLSDGDELVLQGFSTEGVLRAGSSLPRLKAFHTTLMHCLAGALSNAKSIEASRLAKRASQTAEKLEGVLSRFVDIVNRMLAVRKPTDFDDPLVTACAAVCQQLGIKIEPSPALNRRRSGDTALTVEHVAGIARFRVRNVMLRGEWWLEDNGPLLAFIEEEERKPVALLPVAPGKYSVFDPSDGSTRPFDEKLIDNIIPQAHTFFPPLPDRALTIWDLAKFGIGRCRFDIFFAVIAGILGGILGLATPVATSFIFNDIIPGHQIPQLYQIGTALIIAAASATIFKLSGDVAMLRIEGKVAGQLQAAVIDRLLRLPNSFHANYAAGDLASRMMAVESIRRAMAGLLLSSVMALIYAIFGFAALVYYHPLAAFICGLLFIMAIGAAIATGLGQLKAIMEGEAMSGNIASFVLQLVSGITKLRMAGAENRAFTRWGNDFAEMRTRMLSSKKIGNRFTVFLSGYEAMAMAAIFTVIAIGSEDTSSTGDFLAFVAAFTMFMGSILQVARAIIQCFAVVPLVKFTEPILSAQPEVDSSKADPGRLSGNIEVVNTTFRYERGGPKILDSLSITIRPGEFIALVGPSGCGKSTLMKLLLGFERPETGGIYYDSRDLRNLDMQAVRRQIGVVLQTGKLMPGSLYENIRGPTDASVDEAWEAARMAGIEEDIRAMPMGLHTVLTEGTASLSGGQVQRLLIARALVGKPRILLFDEATSALDNRTQAVVTESLSRLNVTRIAIAHRLSTVMEATRIYVLEGGKVAEMGTYSELMAKNGIFAGLAKRQLT